MSKGKGAPAGAGARGASSERPAPADQGARIGRVRIVVSGLVQGVGFRSFVQRTALDLGLSGWVRNREDGKVEAVLEGDADSIARAVEACKRGPARATVGRVDLAGEKAEGLRGFRVED